MEVRHINRSSSATRQPKVDTGANTGANTELESGADCDVGQVNYISPTSVSQQLGKAFGARP